MLSSSGRSASCSKGRGDALRLMDASLLHGIVDVGVGVGEDGVNAPDEFCLDVAAEFGCCEWVQRILL